MSEYESLTIIISIIGILLNAVKTVHIEITIENK